MPQQPNQDKKPLSIPMSAFPPVFLERPLTLFGATFDVHISTSLTFSPDTVLKAVIGISLAQWIRIDESRLDRPLNALMRAGMRRNKPSETTRKLVKKAFSPFLGTDALDAVLRGQTPKHLPAWQSDWEVVKFACGAPGEDELYQLIARFAQLDRVAYEVHRLGQQGGKADAEELLTQHICQPLEYWRQNNLDLNLQVMLLIDVGLQTLAWWAHRDASVADSEFLKLLSPGKRPIGQWLLRVQEATSSDSLQALSALLLRKGVTFRGRPVSHDLLKKWSSGQQLMSLNACKLVLRAEGKREGVDVMQEKRLFTVARSMSFLCDLLIAGTRGKAPAWADAQEALRRRYSGLLELEVRLG